MSQQPIVVERVFDAPVATVWKAITDKEEMKIWYFNLAAFKAEEGFQFQFYGGPEEGTQYFHLCEVTEVVQERKLTYSWRYDGFAGQSLVTFELIAENGKTRLRLTHAGLDTFPADNPDLNINNFKEGWNSIINTSLKSYLEENQN